MPDRLDIWVDLKDTTPKPGMEGVVTTLEQAIEAIKTHYLTDERINALYREFFKDEANEHQLFSNLTLKKPQSSTYKQPAFQDTTEKIDAKLNEIGEKTAELGLSRNEVTDIVRECIEIIHRFNQPIEFSAGG